MEPNVELNSNQITGLYIFLKHREDELDIQCRSVLRSLEHAVQGMFSIEELEQMLEEQEGKDT